FSMTLRPDEWARIKEVFAGAQALAVGDRTAYVASACAGDAALRERVDRLLAAHQLANSFLETPPTVFNDSSVTIALHGSQIAGYELLALIGAGGMGEVYKAHDRNLDRPVALKLLPVHLNRDPERLRRFRAEARAASSLNHP